MSIKKWILFFLGIYIIYCWCFLVAICLVAIPIAEIINLLVWLQEITPLHFSFLPEDTFFYGVFLAAYLASLLAPYFYAKLFGFFKCVDEFKINAVLKFLFAALISAIFFGMLKLPYILTGGEAFKEHYLYDYFKECYISFSYPILLLPLHFLLYKLFQKLSIKFPKFALIGKYTSKDFYFTKINNLFTKIKNKFSKRN